MKKQKEAPRRIVYHPPSREAIEEFARKACEQLAKRDTSYLNTEITTGLSRFLGLAADIIAKNLNDEDRIGDKSLANKNK